MPKLSGINHLRAIKALEKAGFHIDRQGKHVFMSKGSVRVGRFREAIPIDDYVIDVLMLNSDRIVSRLRWRNWRALLLFKKTHGVTREETVALRHGSLDPVA